MKNKISSISMVIGILSAAFLTACGPPKVLDPVNVGPNETAWVIPLTGSSLDSQVKFNSVEFLNERKVSVKRIMVDKVERSTGRLWFDYEWIPSVRVIKVDRSLVTREWTDSDKTGTSSNKQGIALVTKDSVQVVVGLTITASIDETNASTYLYYHGEKTLADVIDQNIRSFAVSELTREYSKLTLSEAQTNGVNIYGKLFEDAKVVFQAKGITIQYLGNAEGLTYADKSVQDAINRSYTVHQDEQTAKMEQNAQKIRNETIILNAKATADAAKELFDAQKASEFQNGLKISLIEAQALTNWNGKLPETMYLSIGQGASIPSLLLTPSKSSVITNK